MFSVNAEVSELQLTYQNMDIMHMDIMDYFGRSKNKIAEPNSTDTGENLTSCDTLAYLLLAYESLC